MQKIFYGPFNNNSDQIILNRCIEYVKAGKGDKFCYIVPTPQMLTAFQNRILADDQLQGTGGLHFYLFNGLFNEVLRDTGKLQRVISPLEQEIYLKTVVLDLIEKDGLEYFQDMVEYDGFYKGLVELIKEFEEGGNNDPLNWYNKASTEKERDLGLIINSYLAYLEENNLWDQGLKQKQMLEIIKTEQTFLDSIDLFVIEGFQRFTGIQYQFIRNLKEKGKDIIINLLYDENRPELYQGVEKIFKYLDLDNKKFEACELETSNLLKHNLMHIEENLFKLEADKIESNPSLKVFECPDMRRETEEIARECRKLIHKGVAPEEIAVITRNPSLYFPFVEEFFEEMELPYSFSSGIPFKQTSVWRVVKKLFQTINNNFKRQQVLDLLKSNFLNLIEKDQYDLIEDIVNEAMIIKGKDWYRLNDVEVGLAGDILNSIYDLQQFRRLLQGEKDFSELAEVIWNFLDQLGLEENILKQSEISWIIRDLKALQELKTRLLHLSDIFKFKITKNEFSHWLERSIEDIEIKIKSEAGSKIQILTPSEARGKKFKYVFINGLLEGKFPLQPRKDWLFTKEEKDELSERGIYLFNEEERLVQERFFFYRSMMSAGEGLYLSYPSYGAEDGGELISSFIQEVKKLFNEETFTLVRINNSFDNISSIKQAATEREAKELYLKQAEQRDLENLIPAYRSEKKRWGNSFTAWDGSLSDKFVKDIVKQKYNDNYIFSVSQLETYANCPFKFYLQRVLTLKDREEPSDRLEPLQLGTLYHQILYNYFTDYFPGNWNQDWSIYELGLTEAAHDVFSNYIDAVTLPTGIWQYYQNEIVSNLLDILEGEWQEKGLIPGHLEMGFGLAKDLEENDDNYPPVMIQSGDKMFKFEGKIDRIDLSKKVDNNSKQKAIIWDYKLSSHSGSYQQMVDGFDLQIPLYIMAVEDIFDDIEVIGAGYYILLKDKKDGIWRANFQDFAPVTGRSKSCLEDEDWKEHLDKFKSYFSSYIEKIRTIDFRIDPEDCNYCDFKDICRYESRRIGGFNE